MLSLEVWWTWNKETATFFVMIGNCIRTQGELGFSKHD